MTIARLSHKLNSRQIQEVKAHLQTGCRRHKPDAAMEALLHARSANILLSIDQSERSIKFEKRGIGSQTRTKKVTANTNSLASTIWNNLSLLEKMSDRLEQVTMMGSTLGVNVLQELEGWDFMDIVRGSQVLFPRSHKIRASDATWTSFTQKIRTINLHGRNYGSLIQPADNAAQLCKQWQQVPKGRQLLTACVSTIHGICHEGGRGVGFGLKPKQPGEHLFEYCACIDATSRNQLPHLACSRAQTLSHANSGFELRSCEELLTHPFGAVIFGGRPRNLSEQPSQVASMASNLAKGSRTKFCCLSRSDTVDDETKVIKTSSDPRNRTNSRSKKDPGLPVKHRPRTTLGNGSQSLSTDHFYQRPRLVYQTPKDPVSGLTQTRHPTTVSSEAIGSSPKAGGSLTSSATLSFNRMSAGSPTSHDSTPRLGNTEDFRRPPPAQRSGRYADSATSQLHPPQPADASSHMRLLPIPQLEVEHAGSPRVHFSPPRGHAARHVRHSSVPQLDAGYTDCPIPRPPVPGSPGGHPMSPVRHQPTPQSDMRFTESPSHRQLTSRSGGTHTDSPNRRPLDPRFAGVYTDSPKRGHGKSGSSSGYSGSPSRPSTTSKYRESPTRPPSSPSPSTVHSESPARGPPSTRSGVGSVSHSRSPSVGNQSYTSSLHSEIMRQRRLRDQYRWRVETQPSPRWT